MIQDPNIPKTQTLQPRDGRRSLDQAWTDDPQALAPSDPAMPTQPWRLAMKLSDPGYPWICSRPGRGGVRPAHSSPTAQVAVDELLDKRPGHKTTGLGLTGSESSLPWYAIQGGAGRGAADLMAAQVSSFEPPGRRLLPLSDFCQRDAHKARLIP